MNYVNSFKQFQNSEDVLVLIPSFPVIAVVSAAY